MRNRTILFICFIVLMAAACKQRAGNDVSKETPSLAVKRNPLCREGVVCITAEFKLNKELSADNTMITRMDKEMAGCFEMGATGKRLLPVAAERVNNGIPNELVYVLYFENNAKDNSTNNKIIYNDRFFGWKNKEFIIERN